MTPGLKRELGLFDATMLVAGSMIGSAIFIVAAPIARQSGSTAGLLAVWLIAALMTLAAASSYGELASMIPSAGGQYVYLRKAWGPRAGFLYGWTLLGVIQSGTIAAVSVAFAKFSAVLLPWFSESSACASIGIWSVSRAQALAAALIAALTWANLRGVKTGKIVQNLLTASKILALILVVSVLLRGRNPQVIRANFAGFWSGAERSFAWRNLEILGTSMVGALFALDAWNNVTFVSAEVRNPQRTVAASLILGSALAAGLYLCVNASYLAVLPLKGSPHAADLLGCGIQFAPEDRVATAAVRSVLGPWGEGAAALLILMSCAGCANGMILSGARVYYAMALDGLFFRSAASLNGACVPSRALVLQGLWTAGLCLSGSYTALLDYVIFAGLLFYVFTVGAVFRLRRLEPGLPRPWKAWGYPIVPLFYIILAGILALDILVGQPRHALPGLAIVFSGLPAFYFWSRASAARGLPA